MNAPRQRGRASLTTIIVVAAFAAALGLWLGSRHFAAPTPPALTAAVLYPAPRAIPDFSLARADGGTLTAADWKGRYTVVFFGYTSCPDVCPTTLQVLKQAHDELKRKGLADKVRIDFISVDPQRDTPQRLGEYVHYFSPDFVAATGSDEELTRLSRALGLVYAREPDGHGGYSVDHSASAVIVDPQGRELGLFRPPLVAESIAGDLERLLGWNG